MIEINLVPDVKQELIKAQRVRTSVISISVIVGIAAISIMVVLAIWVFGVQAARGLIFDDTIKKESQKLSSHQDLSNTLTIQNQLSKITELHATKSIDSRVFDVLTTINPAAPNTVAITNLVVDAASKTVTIEAQAANGYPALENFKKTINATQFTFLEEGKQRTVPLASAMSDSDRSYGDDASGTTVLRFTISFEYPQELLARNVQSPVIVAPTRSNVTDSFLGVPNSLFTQKASDQEEK